MHTLRYFSSFDVSFSRFCKRLFSMTEVIKFISFWFRFVFGNVVQQRFLIDDT